MAGAEEGSASADARIDSTKPVVIVAAGFSKERLNNYGTLGENRAERQQSHRRIPPVLVALKERGEHRAAEGACPIVGRNQWINIVSELPWLDSTSLIGGSSSKSHLASTLHRVRLCTTPSQGQIISGHFSNQKCGMDIPGLDEDHMATGPACELWQA